MRDRAVGELAHVGGVGDDLDDLRGPPPRAGAPRRADLADGRVAEGRDRHVEDPVDVAGLAGRDEDLGRPRRGFERRVAAVAAERADDRAMLALRYTGATAAGAAAPLARAVA